MDGKPSPESTGAQRMTELLEHAVAVARGLDDDAQDRVARAMLQEASLEQPLTDEEREWLKPRLEAADRGEFVSLEEVQATLDRYRT